VPAVAAMQSVDELPAPIGRNGGAYGVPGARHSRSSFSVRGRITDGGMTARRLKRAESRSFSCLAGIYLSSLADTRQRSQADPQRGSAGAGGGQIGYPA